VALGLSEDRGRGSMAVHRGTVRAESSPRFRKGSVRWVTCRRLGNDPIPLIPLKSDMRMIGRPVAVWRPSAVGTRRRDERGAFEVLRGARSTSVTGNNPRPQGFPGGAKSGCEQAQQKSPLTGAIIPPECRAKP
jgi:hypothetical protein